MKNRLLLISVGLLLFSTLSFATPPKAPALTAKVNGLNVDLSWTRVKDATGYAIYYTRSPFQGVDKINRFEKGNNLNNTITLFLGDSYYVAVKAYNKNKEESRYSNIELVSVNQLDMLHLGLSRHQHNDKPVGVGTFQLLADINPNIKLTSVRLVTPINSEYSDFNIKSSNQIELFIKEDRVLMEPELVEGTYHLEADYYLTSNPSAKGVDEVTFNVVDGNYPPFPNIKAPAVNAVGVSLNPTINFVAEKPTTLSITEKNTKIEVFYTGNVKYASVSDGSKSIKIDSVKLKPKTKYILEINQTDKSIAKGSTSAVSFTTK